MRHAQVPEDRVFAGRLRNTATAWAQVFQENPSHAEASIGGGWWSKSWYPRGNHVKRVNSHASFGLGDNRNLPPATAKPHLGRSAQQLLSPDGVPPTLLTRLITDDLIETPTLGTVNWEKGILDNKPESRAKLAGMT